MDELYSELTQQQDIKFKAKDQTIKFLISYSKAFHTAKYSDMEVDFLMN